MKILTTEEAKQIIDRAKIKYVGTTLSGFKVFFNESEDWDAGYYHLVAMSVGGFAVGGGGQLLSRSKDLEGLLYRENECSFNTKDDSLLLEKDLKIKEARKEAGLTQRQFSELFDPPIPINTIKKWDSGLSYPPTWIEKFIIEMLERRTMTHGLSNTRLYSIFHNMKHRCYNPNDLKYAYYGGKGITICDEWLDDFQKFYDWSMENGYEEHLTIDRIDSKKPYQPDNCRWITMKENQERTSHGKNCPKYSVEKARVAAGLTQKQFSELFEIPLDTVKGWDSGRRRPPLWAEKLIIEKLDQMKEQ